MKKLPCMNRLNRKGFTLIELLVVVTIIAVLAALIVPALQKAQSRTMTMKCLSQAKAIAASIRTYASGHDGWTNPDPHSVYIKDAGYKIASEEGYFGEAAGTWAADNTTQSYQKNFAVRTFRCPVDEGPRPTAHAVPSSYQVVSPFNGSNIMNLTSSADRTICAIEVGARHPKASGEGLDRIFVYADLHAALGYTGDVFDGLLFRVWNSNTQSGVLDVNADELPGADVDNFATNLNFPRPWTMSLVGELDATKGVPNDWNNTIVSRGYTGPTDDGTYINNINNVVARLDGFIRFPEAGTWEFRIGAKGHYLTTWFGIASPGSSPYGARSEANYSNIAVGNAWNGPAFGSLNISVSDPSLYYPIQCVYRSNVWSGSNHLQGGFQILWRRDEGGGNYDADYGGTTGVNIPASAFSTLPF